MIHATRKRKALHYAVAGLFLIWTMVPFLWMIRTTLLTNFGAISTNTPIVPFLSEEFSIESYFFMWTEYDFGIYFKNSIIVSLAATVLSLLIGIPAAYAFARLDFPGRKVLFYWAVFSVMFPWIVITVPVYEIFYYTNLLNTYAGIILALTIFVQPIVLWLLQGFFRQGIPDQLEEAAQVDGLSRIGAFFRIVLPLSAPAVAASGIFTFQSAWNNFLWVFILTRDEKLRTATVAVHYMLGTDSFRNWSVLMAGLTILTIPPILFYFSTQRYINVGLGGPGEGGL
jgi:multiple sugar transport system permease protein